MSARATWGRTVTLAALGLLMLAPAAAAQMGGMGGMGGMGMGGAQPGPAIFGGAQGQDPNAPRRLVISAQALAGYDDNILGQEGGFAPVGPDQQLSSKMAGGGASLMYGENRQRVSWGASAGTQYNKLFDVDDFDMYAYNGGASMAVGLSQRSSLSLGVNAAVQPFFQFGLVGMRGLVDTQVPGGALPVFQGPGFNAGTGFTPDLQASQLQLLQYGAGAGYQYRLGPRTNAHAMAGYSSFRPLGEDAPVNFGLGFMGVGMRSVGGGISHAVSQNLSARAGYYYRTFDQPMAGVSSDRVVGHDIDVGMNYNRGFELARRTTFSFGTGSSVMRTSGTLADQTGTSTFAFVTGNANLTRLFLRTWSSSLSYMRGVSYVAGLQGFALNDTVAANVGGLFTDRLDASAGVAYTSGAFGFGGGGERFQTTSGGGQLRYGLSRNLATFVSYSYARFNFPSSMLLPAGFPNAASRQGIRAGLTFWFDVLR